MPTCASAPSSTAVRYFERHLREVPLHRAIIRTAEAVLFASVSLPRPLLDVGCGDGHFAALVHDEPVDAGIDPNLAAAREAVARRAYRRVVVASGTRLPFADHDFASVMSNCVLEHIPDLDGALREIARVLRPGGVLVCSVPSQQFPRYLLGAALPRALGLTALGRAYGAWFNRLSAHYHTYDLDGWRARLAAAGFEVVRWQGYLGPTAMKLFDLSHYYGAPTLLTKRLTGRWVLVPDKVRWWPPERWLARWLVRYCEEDAGRDAAYYFFVCRRASGT
ncbi:MAG TPA: class I SAM-dependent methyltransferase [Chloroflexota bacterium]|jgi:SAM-dependent methyltransferase|nr:class I SAM-dependent methyltransferase [Chloroflexota bacterium]